MESALMKITSASSRAGWHLVPAIVHGTCEANPDALQVGGRTYPTIVSQCGNVKIGLSSTDIYMHNGNVWYGDPTVTRTDELTVAGIYTRSDARLQGHASQAMLALCKWADALGVKLSLVPCPFEAAKEKRPKGQRKIASAKLRTWYRGLGFTEYQRIMRREPRTVPEVYRRQHHSKLGKETK